MTLFPPDLHNTIDHKQEELGAEILRESSPPPNLSCVMCHMSHVFFLFFFLQSGEACRWRVCYQRCLPRLVLFICVLCFAIFLGKISPKTDIIKENKILSR